MRLTNEELDQILAQAGLRMNEPYNPKCSYRKDKYIFTKCMTCGVEAHYRLKYILDKNEQGEKVCRACYWLAWYGESHEMYDQAVQSMIAQGTTREELRKQGVLDTPKGLQWDNAAALAKQHGYELVDLLTGEREDDEVMIVRCTSCGRQTAERPADVKFGCTCRK